MLITLFYNKQCCIIGHTNSVSLLCYTYEYCNIDLILFYKAQDLRYVLWEPPTVIQTSRLLASITVERTSILLGQQTPRSERRQFLYTAVHHLVAWTSTQALANQRPQLQLRLQLARTQPSGNGIKYGSSATRSSVQQFQYDQQSVQIGSTISSSALGRSLSWQQPPLAWAATLRTVDRRPCLYRHHAPAPCSTQHHYTP
jgi:hypothetical protein